jgi:glutamine synthetase
MSKSVIPENILTPVCFEYVWIDGNDGVRSKNRILYYKKHLVDYGLKEKIEDPIKYFVLSKWNFDGSSTNQAEVATSEVILVPVQAYLDPFLSSDTQLAYLVLCETYNVDGTPHKSNTRNQANAIFEKFKDEIPWYGIEQEFFLLNRDTKHPLGFIKCARDITPIGGEGFNKYFYIEEPPAQGPYYCGVGSNNAFERKFVLDVYNKCLKAGLRISGMNGEVAPGNTFFI